MTLNLTRLRCPMCNSRFLQGVTLSACEDGVRERVEATCRQKHTVRLTVRKVEGKGYETKKGSLP